MIAPSQYDVIVLGGGLAGLTLTRQLLLKHPQMRIAVIEKRSFPVAEATCKVGESTVEIGAHYLAENLKLKKHLIDDQLPKFGLRFFFKDSFQAIDEGTEVGARDFFTAPSYQVDRGRLENYLAELVAEMGADVYDAARIHNVHLEPDSEFHQVAYTKDDVDYTLSSRWIVDASGRAAVLKRKLDLAEEIEHEVNAIWFRINSKIEIDKWSTDTSWHELTGKVPRRWLSTNHLMGEGYWVWLIPLASGSTSVGIVADPRIHPLDQFNSLEKMMDWLEEFEPECYDSIQPDLDKVQDFLAMKNLARSASQVFSKDRWALVGEAGVFLDPFYSPGSDFIAIGNTMVCKLIEESLAGKPVDQLAPTLQSVYLTLFQNNLTAYKDQYPLFGNPRIMAIKFVWDYAVYWGFPALLFFSEKLTDVNFIRSISKGVEAIREMNLQMQAFFRSWYEADPKVDADAVFVDQNDIELMTRLNAELVEKLDDESLKQRFDDNVAVIRELMFEIAERVQQSYPDIETDIERQTPTAVRLNSVFDSLHL